jgi:hypothetical protein
MPDPNEEVHVTENPGGGVTVDIDPSAPAPAAPNPAPTPTAQQGVNEGVFGRPRK